jgi:hypothetical protein
MVILERFVALVTLENLGVSLKDSIIDAAEYLTLSDSRPGIIAAILIARVRTY